MNDFETKDVIVAYGPNNTEYKIIETTLRRMTGNDSGYKTTPVQVGPKSLRLETGEVVNKIDDNTYEIVSSGIRITTKSI